jgi:putative transposase
MKRSRTGSSAGAVLASAPVATVQLPLPLLDLLADTRTPFFGLCLDAGQQVLRTMMEQDRAQLCGPKHVPNPGAVPIAAGVRAARSRSAGAGSSCRACVRGAGHELALASFLYAAGRDPLDARTLEAIAIGVTTRKYRRALDLLPAGTRERAVCKSSVSRRFVALTKAPVATWLARPLDDLTVRVI